MKMLNRHGINHLYQQLGDFRAIFLSRTGGVSEHPYDALNMSFTVGDAHADIVRNFTKVSDSFALPPETLIRLEQSHSNEVLIIRKNSRRRVTTQKYDAVITDDTSLTLTLLTADCVPLLLVDTEKRVFAAVHAGWRGTAAGIARRTARLMRDKFGCNLKNIRVAIGPAIGVCCYEVSAEVLCKLTESVGDDAEGMYLDEDGMIFADLRAFNRDQLVQFGVPDENIISDNHCSYCEEELFFSYRRQGNTGRQMSLVGLKLSELDQEKNTFKST